MSRRTDFEALQLTATAPDRLDDRVLPALGVDLPTLRRLDATGLLTRARGGLVYRHELARQALENTIPPGGGPGLHARLLDALERIEPGSRPSSSTTRSGPRAPPRRAVRQSRCARGDSGRFAHRGRGVLPDRTRPPRGGAAPASGPSCCTSWATSST